MQNDKKKTESAPAAKPNAGATNCHPEPHALCEVKEPKPSFAPYVRLGRPRPSQIMYRMNRHMHARWLEKLRPAKSAEQKRDEVMKELDSIHAEAVRTTIFE